MSDYPESRVLWLVKELLDTTPEKELREIHALVFDMNMRARLHGSSFERTALLVTLLQTLLKLKGLRDP